MAVQILIDTVLFHHEHIATHSQEFVQLIRGQLPKRLLVKYQFLSVDHLYSLYDTLLLSLFTYFFKDDAKLVISDKFPRLLRNFNFR